MSTLKRYINNKWETVGGQIVGDTLPIGSIVSFSSENVPNNWLICDGAEISRTEYSQLYDVIGVNFGNGDGETTFNLPDLRGKFLIGKDENDSDFSSIGEIGGEKTHRLTVNEMPEHTHTFNSQGSNDISGYVVQAIQKGTNTMNTNSTGGGDEHNNIPPYFTGLYIIKAYDIVIPNGSILNNEISSVKDTYSCNFINNNFKKVGKTLFEGSSTSDIQLNDSIENYTELEIFFSEESGFQDSVKVLTNVKSASKVWISTTCSFVSSSGGIYVCSRGYTAQGNSIIANANGKWSYILGGSNPTLAEHEMRINKVVGYK